jgi:hypothetical protein
MLIVIAAIYKLEIHQMDVKNNFFKMLTLMRRFTWKNLRGLLLMDKKKKSVNLSNYYVV